MIRSSSPLPPRVERSEPSTTGRLLAALTVAGPVYVLVAATQVATRDGFDIRRHPVSLLSNGDLGWIQITNFVLAGLLVTAGAVGTRRVMSGGRGATWIPRSLAGYGLGLVASGVFVADPADGFPPGTPAGMPDDVGLWGILHFAGGGLAFACLIVAAIAVGRRAAEAGEVGWSRFSWCTGVLLAVSFASVASGIEWSLGNELFTSAVVISWIWMTLLGSRTGSASSVTGGRSELAAGGGDQPEGVR